MTAVSVTQSVRDSLDRVIDDTLIKHAIKLRPMEVGTVTSVGRGVTTIDGLHGVQTDEVLELPNGAVALAFNLDAHEIGAILLDGADSVRAGDEVRRTGRMLDVPVDNGLLGRVIDPLGRPLDRHGIVRTSQRRACERDAPAILDRLPVTVPLQTGLKVVDALIPIGRGQRELIIGDRQTGKTAIAIDTILNQRSNNVICIYCAIGQRNTAVSEVIGDLRKRGAMDYSIVVVAEGDASPGLQFIAPFSAMTIGEFFMEQGRDVLIVFDDLTVHARAYRELSLLLRRPPGREAFPGDIFYLHSRLLERSTHLSERLGGGSLTTLAIAETNAQDLAAYIPTNLISITDGQIYLSPELFQMGQLPAVDVGRSVSRVGGKTQLAAYRVVAGDLRLSYAQFEELEAFSRFSSRLDDQTRATLERGRRVRAVLQQPQYQPLSAPQQIAGLMAVTNGLFDNVNVARIAEVEAGIRDDTLDNCPDICERIANGQRPNADEISELIRQASESLSARFAIEVSESADA